MSALLGSSADWYLMRASGFVAILPLSGTACLGVANVTGVARKPRTRTVAGAGAPQRVPAGRGVRRRARQHRHQRPLRQRAAALRPRTRHLRLRPAVGGARRHTLDLTVAVVATSLLQAHIGRRAWRAVHWLAYLSWPTALIHAIGSGSGTGADTGAVWSTAIYLGVAAAFGTAVAYPLRPPTDPRRPRPPPQPGRPSLREDPMTTALAPTASCCATPRARRDRSAGDQASDASRVISPTPASALLTGQPALAASACCLKSSSERPGT
jgi:hypothetical protein